MPSSLPGSPLTRLPAAGRRRTGAMLDDGAPLCAMRRTRVVPIEPGINLFATADVYRGLQTPDMEKGYGISEEIIGRWLQRTGRRHISCLEVYQPMARPERPALSAYRIRRACRRACGGCRPITSTCTRCTTSTGPRRRRSGRPWSSSSARARSPTSAAATRRLDVALAQSAALARHFLGLSSEQSLYNLAVRTVELELIPALRSLGIGLLRTARSRRVARRRAGSRRRGRAHRRAPRPARGV